MKLSPVATRRVFLVQFIALVLAAVLLMILFTRLVLLRVPGTRQLERLCVWVSKMPGDDHGIQSRSRPSFPLTAAWLKPEVARYGAAPKNIPPVLRDDYSDGNTIEIGKLYFDEAYVGVKAIVSNWTTKLINDLRKNITLRQPTFTYNAKSIYAALDAFSNTMVKSKRGIVVGSQSPWLESFLLEYGADTVTTLEYSTIISSHPQLATFTPKNFTASFLQGDIKPFDFAFTYSSIEHDGLGRYGDILNPSGDLETMAKMLSVVKPGGFMFLGVPCCLDSLLWNAGRIYGRRRLSQLFAGWHIIAVFPSNAMKLNQTIFKYDFQPVWVLQNTFGCTGGEPSEEIGGLFRPFKVI